MQQLNMCDRCKKKNWDHVDSSLMVNLTWYIRTDRSRHHSRMQVGQDTLTCSIPVCTAFPNGTVTPSGSVMYSLVSGAVLPTPFVLHNIQYLVSPYMQTSHTVVILFSLPLGSLWKRRVVWSTTPWTLRRLKHQIFWHKFELRSARRLWQTLSTVPVWKC
jgi:hypothetical protein